MSETGVWRQRLLLLCVWRQRLLLIYSLKGRHKPWGECWRETRLFMILRWLAAWVAANGWLGRSRWMGICPPRPARGWLGAANGWLKKAQPGQGEGLLSENLEPTLLLIYSLKGRRRRRRPAAAARRLSPVLCRHRRRVSSSRVVCRLSSSVVVRRRRLCCRILSSVACRLFFIEVNDNDGQTLTMMIILTTR